MEITWEAILAVAGAFTAIGGAWITIRKIQKDADSQKKNHGLEILTAAKNEISLLDKEIQARLNALDSRMDTLESSVDKDLQHLRETYNGEIRNLGQKIEDLRSELRNQHTQMVSLLTKMIDNSKD